MNVLEGAVRKWIPGFDSGAGRFFGYFSKDAFFILGLILIILRTRKGNCANHSTEFYSAIAIVLIIIGSVFSLSQGFNVVGSILTLRSLIVLPLVGYLYMNRVKNFPLVGFSLVVITLGLANAPLVLLQNSLPSDHFLNQYAADDAKYIVEVAYGVRATGTFAYITGLSVFSALSVWAGMVVLSLSRTWRTQLLGSLGLLAGLACAFASISRSSVVIVFAMLAIWALSSVKTAKVLWRTICVTLLISLILLVLSPSTVERFMHVGEGAFDRFDTAGDSNVTRVFGQWEELFEVVTKNPIGNGLGTEQLGGTYVTTGSVESFTSYENQFPRIVAELGIVGFLGFVGLVIASIIFLQNTRGGRKAWRWNMVVTATQVYLLGQFYSNLVFNHTGSMNIWLVATAVLAAAPLAKSRVLRRKVRRSWMAIGNKPVVPPGQQGSADVLPTGKRSSVFKMHV